ncbi:MFS transporter [Metabacillus arenae]|uniref:MFS transporter n=1 Tax=Metabacillus arenae TaxID=2771434 RepID=A0A926NI57_9BACI|nr:MFS transporter [Metabacillus arenae]MBD1380983.1 MFS transporter [Metabacillus arenae]
MYLRKSYTVWMFTSLLFIQMTASMSQLGITPILPFIQQELHLSVVQMGYLAAAVQLGIAMCSIPFGLLVDYFGVKWMLFLGGLSVGMASFSLYWLEGYVFILIAFLLIGICYANFHPSISKGILILFPPQIRGTGMGIRQTVVSVSAFIGAVWLPFMAVNYHWKTGYLIIGCFLMLISFTALFFRDVEHEGRKMKDSVNSSLTRSQFVYVLRNETIQAICFTTPFLFIAQFTTAAYLVVDVNERFEIPLIQAGYLLAFLQFGSIVGRIFFGMLGDLFFMHRRELLLACISIATGLIMLAFALNPSNGFTTLSIFAFLIGMTGSGWVGIINVIVIESVEAKYVGVASGITATLGYLSPTIGTPLFGYLHDFFGGFSLPWMILAGSMFFPAVVLYRLQRKKEQDVERTSVSG